MAWSGTVLFGADGRLHSRRCLTSLGVQAISCLTAALRFFFSFSVSHSLILYFSEGFNVGGLGLTLYDDMHWAEGKYQAFWWNGQLGDDTGKGGEAFCWV
jgi:hypothetical protein